MVYCENCGSDISADAKFCKQCGESIGSDAEMEPALTPETQDNEVESEGEDENDIDVPLLTVSVIMGLVAGGFAAWATANMDISTPAFLLVLVGVSYFLYQKRIPSEAVGSGLYITALIMILTPLLFYIPMLFGAEEGTVEGAGQAIGSVLGLVIWGFVFFLFALVTAALGYFFKRRASKKLTV